MTISIN